MACLAEGDCPGIGFHCGSDGVDFCLGVVVCEVQII